MTETITQPFKIFLRFEHSPELISLCIYPHDDTTDKWVENEGNCFYAPLCQAFNNAFAQSRIRSADVRGLLFAKTLIVETMRRVHPTLSFEVRFDGDRLD